MITVDDGPAPANEDPSFQRSRYRHGDIDIEVVAAAGEIDWASAPILREHLAGAMLAGVPHVVLDLAGVTFIDSSGLSVVIRADHQARARQGWLRLVTPPAQAYKVLRMTHLDEALEIYATRDAALTGTQPDTFPDRGRRGWDSS